MKSETAVAIAVVIFGAGGAWVGVKAQIEKIRGDVNGLGAKIREQDNRAERRWRHYIATQIETAGTLEEARQYAELLRNT